MGKITIVGLGPGPIGLITLETMDILTKARTVLLRTEQHPTVAELRNRGIAFQSYDEVYDKLTTFEQVYQTIATDILDRACSGEDVVYAVPGSPLVAERTVGIIREMASAESAALQVLPGMSFLELLYSRLGIDPIAGITVLDAADISSLPPALPTSLVVTQVYNRQVASDAKLALMAWLPDDYEIMAAQWLGLPQENVVTIPLYELDRLPQIDHLTSIYVPARCSVAQRFSFDPLVDIMARLRSPSGCVWDIEQTHTSLRRYIVEEVYEVLEAIDLAEPDKLCEELGDVLLQIVFHARIAEESGVFSMQDVIDTVTRKMVHRHPHVFGDISVRDAAEVVLNWDAIKKQEKGHERQGVLDGVPRGLPSLMRAYKLQGKAAKVGFDWDTIDPVWDKIEEELNEVREALHSGDKKSLEGEVGDLLFTLVNLARFLKIEPETALNLTNEKFIRRFGYIEQYVTSQSLKWSEISVTQMEVLWEQAKRQEY